MGLVVPEWVRARPGFFNEMSNVSQINQIIEVLCSTHMFVGGFLACLLDNTIPGNLKDRGITSAAEQSNDDDSAISQQIYELPFHLSRLLNRCCCTQFLPFLPKYKQIALTEVTVVDKATKSAGEVGLSQLQTVNLNVSRNLFVLGFSIFMGLVVPEWVRARPGFFNEMSNVSQINQIIEVLCSTHMFVGGFLACLLDNTIPGNLKDRGITSAAEQSNDDDSAISQQIYELPFHLSRLLNRCCCTQFLPFLPKYKQIALTEVTVVDKATKSAGEGRSVRVTHCNL
ncbi:putative Solute carrier family 23 member 1 [Hypsibius exemplaris]|uniref:Solute carrier family 23 member 1 n=1 Tax=Hypsibius exemplaris TaxID=2072580 RepID=A0A1W0W975_HYPEX|nr:putative Solute carrier family 23 member 1 [Hypsibius exemplaris]